MPDDRPLHEELLDHVVYAPIGAAVGLAKNLPGALAEGKNRVEAGAKFVGGALRALLDAVVEQTDTSDDSANSTDARTTEADDRQATPPPIEDYDTLATATVVRSLSSLTCEQRAELRSYECSHRNRRTVLGRLDQLDEEQADG